MIYNVTFVHRVAFIYTYIFSDTVNIVVCINNSMITYKITTTVMIDSLVLATTGTKRNEA